MEEADALADRIGIMAHGQLKACGTSLYLKSRFGVGYTFTLSKSEHGSFPVLFVVGCSSLFFFMCCFCFSSSPSQAARRKK
jgi:hypothetical protein